MFEAESFLNYLTTSKFYILSLRYKTGLTIIANTFLELKYTKKMSKNVVVQI